MVDPSEFLIRRLPVCTGQLRQFNTIQPRFRSRTVEQHGTHEWPRNPTCRICRDSLEVVLMPILCCTPLAATTAAAAAAAAAEAAAAVVAVDAADCYSESKSAYHQRGCCVSHEYYPMSTHMTDLKACNLQHDRTSLCISILHRFHTGRCLLCGWP